MKYVWISSLRWKTCWEWNVLFLLHLQGPRCKNCLLPLSDITMWLKRTGLYTTWFKIWKVTTLGIFCFCKLKSIRVMYWSLPLFEHDAGNIRVYCRIRPSFNTEAKGVIDFVGDDGSLVLLDPSKPGKDGRRVFNFNRVFGPTSTQGNKITQQNQPFYSPYIW